MTDGMALLNSLRAMQILSVISARLPHQGRYRDCQRSANYLLGSTRLEPTS